MVIRCRSLRIVLQRSPANATIRRWFSGLLASLLLLFVCAVASPQMSAQPASHIPQTFHDPALGITYFYPQPLHS